MKMRRFRGFLADMWQPFLVYFIILVGLGGLLFVRLGTLVPNFTANEVQSFQASSSIQNIFNHPLDAPYTLVVHGLTYISDHTYLLTRVAAALCGFIVLLAFYLLVQHWYGRRTAFLGTVLFGTTAWFLHTSRFGSADVLLFLPLVLVACGVWFKKSSNPWALLVCFGLCAALMYVPGMVWLVFLAVIWQWRTIDRLFKKHLWIVTLGGLLVLALLAPLGWAIYRMPDLWKTLVGLPADGWPQVIDVLRNLYEVPMAFFLSYRDATPETWLGNVPILDVFSMAMVLLGAFLFFKHRHLQRVKITFLVLLVGWILASLGGEVSLSILVPFVYILVAVGMGFLLDSWLKVFPRNPIAHWLGLILVCVAVLTAASYQLRHYFIAWPRNAETREVYVIPEATAASDKIE